MRVLVLSVLITLSVLQVGGIAVSMPATITAAVAPGAGQSVGQSRPRIDFERQLKPIFQSKCMPCHFSGGQMYERLPFDKPETIRKLGTKLFTRIKDENERRLIDEFIHQGS